MELMRGNWSTVKYFKRREFDSHGSPGTGDNMSKDFMQTLDSIRDQVGTKLVVLSGYRTLDHNEQVGGVPNSAHTKGLAADINYNNGAHLFSILNAALEHGIMRVGIDFRRKFIHLDADSTLPTPTIWTY